MDRRLGGGKVVLLDPATDAPCGTMDKLQAHRLGRYHAAISVLLLDDAGRQLIQQRAAEKYHGGGLWAIACCSHPWDGEGEAEAARRRVREELGIAVVPFAFGTIRYRARVHDARNSGTEGMVENEHVTLFIARHSGPCRPDPSEIAATAWVSAPGFSTPSHAAPWYSLYMNAFGQDLARILENAERGVVSSRDYGTHDLATGPT